VRKSREDVKSLVVLPRHEVSAVPPAKDANMESDRNEAQNRCLRSKGGGGVREE
jgi:hypothetical protein